MNPRERKMALLLGAFILLGGGGFFLYQFLYVPWQRQEANKARLEDEIKQKSAELGALHKELPKLANWRLLSLPSDPVLAKREYELYLRQLMKKSGWTIASFSPGSAEVKPGPTLANKKAMYTTLGFRVDALAPESGIVVFLEEFAKAPVLHKVKGLVVDKAPTPAGGGGNPKGQGGVPGKFGKGNFGDMFGKGKGGFGSFGERMKVQLHVEALIVNGPEKHWTALTGLDDRLVVADVVAGLRGGPVGLAQVPWAISPQGARPPQALALVKPARIYSDIARARLFLGAAEDPNSKIPKELWEYSDVPRFVKLIRITGVTSAGKTTREGEFFNLLTDKYIRLRDDNSGYKQFIVKDDDGEEKVRGVVLRVTDREIYFSSDDNVYVMHIGDTLSQGLDQLVPAAEAKRLGLPTPPSE